MPPRRARKAAAPVPKPNDPHVLYQRAVQCPESEIDFVDATFRRIRGRRAMRLREDFCGTAFTSCEWILRRKSNTAVGLDVHAATLRWAERYNLAALIEEQRARVSLLKRNVLHPGPGTGAMDVVLAMNFSWWVFKERRVLLDYFKSVRGSLVSDGVFFMDIYGGWESIKELREKRRIGGRRRGFTYIWDQDMVDPVNNHTLCHIDFKLANGRLIRRAFTYDWRIWTIPETRELLEEAGFKRVTVYWEGDDGKGGGNGVFKPAKVGECCHTFIAYIVAER